MPANANEHPAVGLFLFALVIHLADFFFGRLSGQSNWVLFFALALSYFFITVYAWKVLGATTRQQKIWYAGFSLLALLLPNIITWIIKLMPILPRDVVGLLLLVMPIWPFYLLIQHSDKIGNKLKTIGWLWIIVWVLIFFISYSGPIKTAMIERVGDVSMQDVSWIQPGTAMKVVFIKTWTGVQQVWNATIHYKEKKTEEIYALGNYEGQVDSKAKEKLGVYFGTIQSSNPEYGVGESVNIFTTLTAKTLDKPLDIKVGCTGPDERVGKVVQNYPENVFHVGSFEQQSIDCIIEGGFALKAGERAASKSIKLSADFGFSTMSYLRSYFMEKERLRGLRRMNIDPLTQYGITDRSPNAISTAGPVLVGMSFGEQLPIGIELIQPQTLTLGITLRNSWTGSITSIDKIMIVVPRGLELDRDSRGSYIVLPDKTEAKESNCNKEEIEGCDASVQNVYVIENVPLPAEVSYTTIRVFLRVRDPDALLGVTPLAMKSVWVIANYNYKLEKSKTVTIKSST